MLEKPFISKTVGAKSTSKVFCPIAGKGFSSIVVRTGGSHLFVSIVEGGTEFYVSEQPTNLRFNGGDNTVPGTLYIRNATSADVRFYVFIEEVGSNPV